MKIVNLLLLTLLPQLILGQPDGYFVNWYVDLQIMDYKPIKYVPPKDINQIKYSVFKKEGGQSKDYLKRFDGLGHLLGYSKFNNKSEEVKENEFEYNAIGQVSKSIRYRRGKIHSVFEYEAMVNGKPLRRLHKTGKGATKRLNTWTYNSDTCLISSELRKGNRSQLYRKWVHTYYSGCVRKRSIVENGKGKVLESWSYECKAEGEKLSPNKNETQVCKWESVSQEYLIKIYQSFDEKGRIRKTVSKFTINDTLPLGQDEYNERDELLRHFECDKDYNKPIQSVNYKNGKERYRYNYQYENGLLVSWDFYFKKKPRARIELSYNDKNQMIQYKSVDGKGRLKKLALLEYK